MDIVKQLNLNRIPKNIKDYSLVYAKNIKLDNTNTYITNDFGFKEAFCANSNNSENDIIVGCIDTPKELVIFLYNSLNGIYIKRLQEDKVITQNLYYYWYGGEIFGTYQYNYKNELTITVSEKNNTIKDVPLKIFNLDNTNFPMDWSIAPDIPKLECTYTLVHGSLLCGVYTFFIRFGIDDYNFTTWYEITPELYVINGTNTSLPGKGNLDITDDPLSVENKAFNLVYNSNNKSNHGILLNFGNLDTHNYKKYQIGYILKRDESIVGRIHSENNIATVLVNIQNNTYIEEISIDDLLKNSNNFINVNVVKNIDNRIYIANYEEQQLNINNESIYNCIKNIKINKQDSNWDGTYEMKYYSGHFNTQANVHLIDGTTKFFEINLSNFRIPVSECEKFIDTDGFSKYKLNSDYKYRFFKYFIINNIASFNLSYNILDLYLYYSYEGKTDKVQIFKYENSNWDDNLFLSNIDVVLSEEKLYSENEGYSFLLYYNGKYPNVFPRLVLTSPDYENGEKNIIVENTYALSKLYYKEEIIYENKVNNIRKCLIPYQPYNVFIHFITENHSYTNGIKIYPNKDKVSEELQTNNEYFLVTKQNTPYTLVFSNINIPEGYIGCFFSYEKVIPMAYQIINLGQIESKTVDNLMTPTSSPEFVYNQDLPTGNKVCYKYQEDNKTTFKETNIDSKGLRYYFNPLLVPFILGANVQSNDYILTVYNNNFDGIYNSNSKILFRFTDNIYKNVNDNKSISTLSYSPNFYNGSKLIYYNRACVLNPTANPMTDDNFNVSYDGKIDTRNIKLIFKDKGIGTHVPIDAATINLGYEKGYINVYNDEGLIKSIQYNEVLSPNHIPDLLRIPAAYKHTPSKIYTNFNEKYINKFPQTLRRSNVTSDESLTTGYRIFDVNDYKNIFENKGAIINLCKLKDKIIIHTEQSIFVIDTSPKINIKIQLEKSDLFDLPYTELIFSNVGEGGINSENECIVSELGYIWYSNKNKKIYCYDTDKIVILSNDIEQLLNNIDIETVYFANDNINSRLFICIKEKSKSYTTLSFNYITKTFISLHDFSFTNTYTTSRKLYFFDKYKDNTRLFTFDENSKSYLTLSNI